MLRHVAPTNAAAAQPEATPHKVDDANREQQPA
jgi:hypothetical protein